MIRAVTTLLVTILLGLVISGGGLLIGLLCRPQRLMSWASMWWARGILAAAGVRLTVEGLDRLASGEAVFFVGNHQSALDIPILISALRGKVRFMAKKSLFRVPVWGWWLSVYGYIPVDRSNVRATRESVERMFAVIRRAPMSYVVFPEGTRSTDGRLLPFRRGAMKICRRSGLGVVPFSIDGSLAVLKRGVYRIHPGPVRLSVAPSISAGEVEAMSSAELHDRVRAAVAGGLPRDGEAPGGRAATPAVAEESARNHA